MYGTGGQNIDPLKLLTDPNALEAISKPGEQVISDF